MNAETPKHGASTCLITAGVFLLGLLILAIRLRDVQVNQALQSLGEVEKQSIRMVQTDGVRGRILDRHGVVLAGNRPSVSLALNAVHFQKKTQKQTAEAIRQAIDAATKIVGEPSEVSDRAILRHLNQTLARPLVVWRDMDDQTLACVSEHLTELPGFLCLEGEERVYPHGTLAAHLLGYVGRDRTQGTAGDVNFKYYDLEMRGRAGIEHYYDSFLRGMPGELKLRVDARGYVHEEQMVVKSERGPDLQLALDSDLQAVVEQQLVGQKGACVVMDPTTGEVLAFASSPTYNPNDLVPTFPKAIYDRLTQDKEKPMLNRASGGSYAPGSTFKPITGLAGLSVGLKPDLIVECPGYYMCGKMRIRCSRTWGHGPETLATGLRDSCNPYFCHYGILTGTNALVKTARTFGLGSRTGIDFGTDVAGVVPDATWKQEHYNEKWYPGDLAQMSMGQGMLLVSPLQMARVAGALGTGFLVMPHLKLGLPVEKTLLPIPLSHLKAVREGMRLVVAGGTGKRAGEGVDAFVIGKTGTAEIGRGATRRKNTWFIAYAEKGDKKVALALIIENGESGGGTAAPRAGAILRKIFPMAEVTHAS